MKYIFVILFLGAAISLKAQNPVPEAGLREQATQISRRLANELMLNEQEYIQVKKLTYKKLCAAARVWQNYAYAPALRQQKIQELEGAYQWQVRHALNTRQVEQLLASDIKIALHEN